MEKRRALYAQVFEIVLRRDRPRIFLWHARNIMAMTARLSGYAPVPDGLIRIQGMKLSER